MADADDHDDWREPDTPFPPRWRWTIRLSAAYFVLLITCGCLYWAWATHARHRWDATIASIRQRGEPAVAEDLVVEAVDANDDAAPLLLKAANGVSNAFANARLPYEAMREGVVPAVEDQRREAAEIVRRHEPQLTLVRAARARARADWGVRPRSPLMNMLYPHVSGQRDLCDLVTLAAVMSHHAGDDAAALEYVRDIVHASSLLEGGKTYFLVAHQAAWTNGYHAIDFLERNASSLDLSTEPARLAARGLIDDLLDERALRDGWRGGWTFERVNAADIYPSFLAKTWCNPMWRLDTVRRMELMRTVEQAAAFDAYPQASPLLPPILPLSNVDNRPIPEWRRQFARTYPPRLQRSTHLVSDLFLDAERRFPLEFVGRLNRRAAAVRLACRLYEVDTGRPPQRWEELVATTYLPHAPADPFAQAGNALRLVRKADSTALVIYSVGRNGTDEGGDETSTNPNVRAGYKPQPLDRRDIAFLIGPPMSPSPSPTEPDQAQEEQHRRQ